MSHPRIVNSDRDLSAGSTSTAPHVAATGAIQILSSTKISNFQLQREEKVKGKLQVASTLKLSVIVIL